MSVVYQALGDMRETVIFDLFFMKTWLYIGTICTRIKSPSTKFCCRQLIPKFNHIWQVLSQENNSANDTTFHLCLGTHAFNLSASFKTLT